ncbi:MAG: hypothetical protein HOY76_36310 [Streptomyces sp.]|nr:hypothetical protein [Streptomyces sp.]NUS86805.1 hypothetical protein [Streptomyces sp.]
MTTPLTEQQLTDIEQRAAAATSGPWTVELEQCDCSDGYCHHGAYVSAIYAADGERRSEIGDFPDADWQFAIHARQDVPALLAEVRQLRAELALAADATEYRVALPDHGGVTLVARRRNPTNGTGWAVSVPAHGGGRAWTTEGWQDSISALSVDRLFCWPDPATAVAEARSALIATGEGA